MKSCWLLLSALVLLTAADKPEDAVKIAKDKLRGTWDSVSMEHGGDKRSWTGRRYTFEGDVLFVQGIDAKGKPSESELRYKLDPSKDPKAIDIINGERTGLGIYKIEGETLTIAFSFKERSTGWQTKKGGDGAIFVFKRAKAEWKEFTCKDGGFKVRIPGKFAAKEVETESDFGKGVLHMNTVRFGPLIYGANYIDYPAEVKKAPLKRFFDASRDGAVANMDGKLSSEMDVKLGEHPGREIRIDVAGGKRLFRARVYLVGQRLYQVVVFGSPEAAASKEADQFLDSFKLTEKQQKSRLKK